MSLPNQLYADRDATGAVGPCNVSCRVTSQASQPASRARVVDDTCTRHRHAAPRRSPFLPGIANIIGAIAEHANYDHAIIRVSLRISRARKAVAFVAMQSRASLTLIRQPISRTRTFSNYFLEKSRYVKQNKYVCIKSMRVLILMIDYAESYERVRESGQFERASLIGIRNLLSNYHRDQFN